MKKLLIFDTHPIQYRAPLFQEIERIRPGICEVVYASDFSIRGYKDVQFGVEFSWDTPLLEGYPYRILENDTGKPADGWKRFGAKGIDRLIGDTKPDGIFLNTLGYSFAWAAYWAAVRRRIPVFLRIETNDEAVRRSSLKGKARGLVYRAAYSGVSRFFYIGELNKAHFLKHGADPRKLTPAHYCTVDAFGSLDDTEKAARRKQIRDRFGIADDKVVVSFFGKLIPKKNPDLIFEALKRTAPADASKFVVLIVGAGELEDAVRSTAADLQQSHGIATHFAGFVNQTALPDFYLASDIVALPSRRMGETWGLVVNEALQAGCAVAISDAVGSHADFGALERVRVFPVGDADALASSLESLAQIDREFDWAQDALRNYSIRAAAESICREIAL